MSVTIFIPPFLMQLTNSMKVTNVTGNTVGECVDDLIQRFPKIRELILNDDGKLLDNIGIYINGEIAHPDELTKAVNDGDEIHIINVIAGG